MEPSKETQSQIKHLWQHGSRPYNTVKRAFEVGASPLGAMIYQQQRREPKRKEFGVNSSIKINNDKFDQILMDTGASIFTINRSEEDAEGNPVLRATSSTGTPQFQRTDNMLLLLFSTEELRDGCIQRLTKELSQLATHGVLVTGEEAAEITEENSNAVFDFPNIFCVDSCGIRKQAENENLLYVCIQPSETGKGLYSLVARAANPNRGRSGNPGQAFKEADEVNAPF